MDNIIKSDQSFDLSVFILQELIGQGSFGKVYKVKNRKTGEIFAAKVSINKFNDYSSDIFMNLANEVNIISKLNHPSILKFKGFSLVNFKKKDKPVIITEFALNGSLDNILHQEQNSTISILDDTQKLIIIYGIASAMSYLHSNGIIHRDLKSGSILIDEYLFPKIADFGLSKVHHLNFESITKSFKGTPIYMSPEIWKNAEYSQSSDVYAFSIIVFEIMTNQKPFDEFNIFKLAIKVKDGYRPEFKRQISKSYQSLIISCWSENPSSRPTFDEIVYKLKTDKGFITAKVDEDKFLKYIKYIEEYKVTFNSFKNVIQSENDQFEKVKIKEKLFDYSNLLNDYLKCKLTIFPFKKFIKLEENCRKLVIDAERDKEKLFLLAKNLIEGSDLFIQNCDLGLKYLKFSIKAGNFESIIYYIKMLIKGDIIHDNLDKAKKLIETKIKEKISECIIFSLAKFIKKKEILIKQKKNLKSRFLLES